MKKIYFLTIFLFTTYLSNSQSSISLTFTAEYNFVPTALDSIKIVNMSQGGDTMIYDAYPGIVLHEVTVAFQTHANSETKDFNLQCFPNPFNNKTQIKITLNREENINVSIYNLLGVEVASYQSLMSRGNHEFSFYPGNENIYFLVADVNHKRKVIKMVHIDDSGNKTAKLKLEGTTDLNTIVKKEKSNFSWIPGNELMFVSFITDSSKAIVVGADTIIDTPFQNTHYHFYIVTFSLPDVATSSVSGITDTSAICGGVVIDDGGSTVTARGVCWSSTNQNPTTSYFHTTDSTGTGSFTSNITGLWPNTTYYVRAYATNSVGTAYGNQVSFTTSINHCAGVTAPPGYGIVESSGRCWLDRNLGATQVATSSTDTNAYGDLYQWGRGTDGHQLRTSGTTTTLSNSDTPGHSNFIISSSGANWDWRSPKNDFLWQALLINNPCPPGWRIPTIAEWNTERQSWGSDNAAGAYASPLKLPVAGSRSGNVGSLGGAGVYGYYWSNTVSHTNSRFMGVYSSFAGPSAGFRSDGRSVRCIKDN